MSQYIKLFNTHAEYEAYTASTEFITPNVSACVDENEAHFNPYVETRVVAKFNVTDTSSPKQLCHPDAVSQFSAIEIDGVVQPSVVNTYTFSTTGEHTVKYTLTDPTTIGTSTFESCRSLTSVTIPNSVTSIEADAFYDCDSVSDVYCYQNPANLTWSESDKDDFKEDGSTRCHVYPQYLSAYQSKFGDVVNVTFVGDLT